MRILRLIAGAALAVLAAAAPLSAGSSEDITRLNDNWVENVRAGDIDGIVAYFDDESEFLHRNPRIQARGAGAARAEFKKLFAQYNVTLRLKQRRVSALPILIQEDGEYEETLVPVHGGETLHVSGRYITTYLRTATVRRFRVQKIWLH